MGNLLVGASTAQDLKARWPDVERYLTTTVPAALRVDAYRHWYASEQGGPAVRAAVEDTLAALDRLPTDAGPRERRRALDLAVTVAIAGLRGVRPDPEASPAAIRTDRQLLTALIAQAVRLADVVGANR